MSEAIQLLAELRRQGVNPTGINADSRRVTPGELFVALPGARHDGRTFIAEAAARGAVGVVCEQRGEYGDHEGETTIIPRFEVTDVRAISGELADHVYDHPSSRLSMIGVTGTNGKTSVSQWVSQAFKLLGHRCGVIGTLGSGFPGALADLPNTTPDVISVHRILAEFLAARADSCVMEASSIGLDQGRTNAVAFDIAVYTNLTRDHLDYHGSMDAYASAKARLFESPGLSAAVINLDDAFGRQLVARIADKGVRLIGYSLDQSQAATADDVIRASNMQLTDTGLRFTVHTPQGSATVDAPLFGRFNAANLLAVLGVLIASNIPLQQAVAALQKLTPPAGRMQAIGGAKEPLLVVDYAHTPDALEQVLVTLREVASARGGRLMCVFGCGGERDRGKRPLMGEVVARLADLATVTSDNPRGEDPRSIIAEITQGMQPAARIETDRTTAIRSTVRQARQQDVILIAGKGHEEYQEIDGRRLPFSDVDQATEALATWRIAA